MRHFRGLDGMKKVIGAPAEYHIVKRMTNGEVDSYDIYFDNQPCLLAGKNFSLSLKNARRITDLLNGELNNAVTGTTHSSRSTSSC